MTNIEYIKKYYKGNIEEAKKQLEEGIPVQYIVGNVNFYGYEFKVNKNVLIPRYETELLVDKTIKRIKKQFKSKVDILDLGTGSGCIAITIRKELDSNVTALDISKEAIEVAKENAKLNDVDIDFINKDMTTYKEKKYDVIISNPPYIKYDEEIMDIVKNNEPHLALYADDNGLYYYKKIIDNIPYITKDKYLIAFEIGNKEAKDIMEYAKKIDANIEVEKDYSDNDRFIFITNIKD
jgi:release factor glutamine methyltransferase